MVKRKGRVYVICKKDPRHKQRQGFHTLALPHQQVMTPIPLQQGTDEKGVSAVESVDLHPTVTRCLEFLRQFKLPF